MNEIASSFGAGYGEGYDVDSIYDGQSLRIYKDYTKLSA